MRRAIPSLAAAAALACALAAPPALAGQVVWVSAAGAGAVWAANDDGTYPHRLLGASAAPLSTQFPDGTLASTEVFQKGGSTVLFTDTEGAFAAPGALCSEPCTTTFSLSAGVLSTPLPAPAPGAAAFASQPRLEANGQIVTRYTLYPAATSTSLGTPSLQGLFATAAGASAFASPWADTATETLPLLADPAPDPADAATLAWVENQDPTCTQFRLAGAPVCQYAIHVAPASDQTRPPVAIFDDEAPPGAGPASLSWSTNGRNLLVVDDQAPNDGIYVVSASTAVAPGSKQVTELLAEPPGWTFGQARFAGAKIVFAAAGAGRSTPGTSDIYSIPATCDSGTCSFPTSATNLSHDAAADNSDPAWTSAAAPLLPLGQSPPAPGAPAALDAASIVARTVSPKTGVSFTVTLSAAGSVNVSISRNGHTIGTTAVRLPIGESTITIKQSGGHALTTGHDDAKLRLASSTAVRYSTSFTVAAPNGPKSKSST